MEQLVVFNGVRVLLTTGRSMREVQSFADQADVVLSIYPEKLPLVLFVRLGPVEIG